MRLYRVTFFAGLGLGYVLGAQAGRERYDQIKRLARQAAENPSVQQAAGAIQAQATATARSARNAATGKVRQGVSKVSGHQGADQHAGAGTAAATAASADGSGRHRDVNGSHAHHHGKGENRPFLPVNGSFAGHNLTQ